MYDESGASYSEGVFTVTKGTTITLTRDVGSATSPLDMYFSIANGVTLTITGQYSLYITNIATSNTDLFVAYCEDGNAATLSLEGGVNAHFTTEKNNSALGNNHIFRGVNLNIEDSSITMTQTGSASSGVAFWNRNDAKITAEDSTIVLDNANGVTAGASTITNTDITVRNAKSGANYLNFDAGTAITGGSISVVGNAGGFGLYITYDSTETVTMNGTDVSIGTGVVVMEQGATLAAEGSTISAGEIQIRTNATWGTNPAVGDSGNGANSATITSATINADLSKGQVATGTNAKYNLNGVTLQTVDAPAEVELTSTTGIVVTGKLTAASATVDSTTQIIVSSGATATLPSTATDVYVASGAGTVTVGTKNVTYDSSKVIEIDAGEEDKLIAAASAEGAKIQINGAMTLTNQNLVIGNGTEVKVAASGGKITLEGTSQIIKNGTGATDLKIESNLKGTNFAQFILNGSYTISSGSIDVTGAVLTGDNTILVRSGEVKISGSLNGNLVIEGDETWGTADVDVIFDDFTVSSGAKLTLNDSFTRTTGEGNGATSTTYEINYYVGPGNAASEGVEAHTANFYLYGAIVTAEGSGDVTISVDSYANFQAFSGASIQQTVTVESVGTTESTVNLGDSLETIRIGDDVVSSNTYSQMQTVLIIDTHNLRPNTTTTIMGQLVIEEGVTLTVMNGATLIIDSATAQMIVTGQIEIEVGGTVRVVNGDEVTITGSITSDGTFYVNSTVNIENGGNVLIDDGEGSTITVTKDLNVKAGGELTIRADMNVTGINNEGTVILNGANLVTKSSEISMAADGAVVDIRSFTADAGLDLTITDDGLVLEKDGNTIVHQVGDLNGAYPGTNKIVFNGNEDFDGVGVRGVTITEVVTSERDADIDDIVYDYGMNVAGTITVVDDTTPVNNNEFNGAYTVSLQGVDMRVAEGETLNLGTKVTLDVAPGFTLNVAGNLNAVSTDSEITTSGTINVTGKIETVAPIEITTNSNGAINAAYYEAEVSNAPHYYYTTLNTAVADGATEIEVMGTITVTESLDIPTGVTVRADGTAVILIGDEDSRDVVVTVADGASIRNFTAGGYIEVFGTLDFDNSRDNRSNRIVSDVSVENTPGISFTNIYTALDNAESGDTVTITRDTATDGAVVLNADVEVKEGVTLVIPNSRTVQVDLGVTLTVNGTVQMLGTITSEGGYDGFNPMNGTTEKDADEYSVIIVNGALMAMSQVPYDVDTANQTYGYYIAGAYYNVVNTTGNWWYVTPVEQAAAVSNDVANGTIIINGDNEAGDVTFTGDETTPVTVTVVDGATLAASSVTLNTATFDVEVGAGFTGSVATAVGSIDLTNVGNVEIIDTTDADDNQIMTFTGTPVKADADGADAEVTIASGNVTVDGILNIADNWNIDDVAYVGIESFDISSGATLTVTGQGSKLFGDELTVDGTLVATDGGNVEVVILTVRGTFTVAEADRENNINAGSADIGVLYVGITCDDDDTDNVHYFSDATAATVNAVDLGDFNRIVVSAESTITGQAIENVDSTEFYVEDALWITVYSDNMTYAFNGPNDTVNYAIQPGDLAESEFIAWNGADGKNVPAGTAIGDVNYEQVYAEINYDVYNVYVVVDNSIGSVAIDGQLLVQNQNGNGYALPNNMKLDAGQHTITYTLAAGYEGTPTLAANGANVTVSGMNFTLSGDYQASNGQTINNYLTLGGATYSGSTVVIDGGNGGSSDMGLTDYLLIVLVILIVIMAIIVALRLMRS